MKAYVFPGQAAQFEGMGKAEYDGSASVRDLFEQANALLGFRITDIMFEGSAEELKQTRVTQPAVFLHAMARVKMADDDFQPDMVAGHSLGEFSALVAAGGLSFEDGLRLVSQRAQAMQKACEQEEGTMAAVLGMADAEVEAACEEVEAPVVPANYNCPGQLVISGTVAGVEQASAILQDRGAKRVIRLQVGGAFHSPLMQPAKEELEKAIAALSIQPLRCPIYQNVKARAERDPESIQQNLIDQLTAPVRWTQTMEQMIRDGATEFIEAGGTGKTLQGFVKKVDRRFPTSAL